MEDTNFIKNIISKDNEVSSRAIKSLVNSDDTKLFEKLCDNCDFIFPFLKEKIVNNFVKEINKDNLKTVFNFSKIYYSDFENLIVKSWLKFANEDLTDELLELLEKGTPEQKAYCALYFSYINDPVALDELKKNAKTDYSYLKINCAKALKAFNETETIKEMKQIVLESKDDFEVLSACEFICAFGDIAFILKNALSSPFCANILLNVFEFCDFNTLKTLCDSETLIKIFLIILEVMPENISLQNLEFCSISDFISELEKINSQYALNALIIAQIRFREFSQNDIYMFDLDKNAKIELKNISSRLNSKVYPIDNLLDELKCSDSSRISAALDVIKEKNIEKYVVELSNLINSNSFSETLCAKGAMILKELNHCNLINKDILNNIQDENLKALIASCL